MVRSPGRDRAAHLPVDTAIRPITEREFKLFQVLVYREAGICLSQAKKALLVGRLGRRLRELGLSSLSAYYQLLTEGGEEERARMLDCICTNETHFFREPRHFEFLESRVLPEWRKLAEAGITPRRLRVWSAGCSTGEEPYSLAMTLLKHLPPSSGWEIELLATDLSTRALEKAREAVWPLEKADEIPNQYVKSFMLKGIGTQAGKMKAGPELRSVVRFQRLNLHHDDYPVAGPFALIFCRNVLIYFSVESRARAVHRLLNRLAPTGYLFLGHAESLNGHTDRVRSVMPTVYALATNEDRQIAAPGGAATSVPQEAALRRSGVREP